MSESQGTNAGMDSSDTTTKPAKGGPSRGLLIGGLVAIVVIAGVILTTNNSDAPRSGTATCATTSQGCEIGDIGPGGGKVYSLGGATSPADCTQYNCLEVAPATWFGSADPTGNWSTAKSRAAAYATSNAAAGTWRLPSQAELVALAGQPTSVSGLASLNTYWSSTAGQTYDRQIEELVAGAYCRTISTVGSCSQTATNVYARPIHTF
jgi:hypothetical protein